MPKLPALPAFDTVSPAQQYDEKAAETFKEGAAVLLDANEEIAECGADPAAILGFVSHPAGKNIPSTKSIVWKASEGQMFWMSGTSNPATNGDNINQSYGLVKDADGIWVVDLTEAVNTRVYVHNVDLDRNLFLVSVLAANRQSAP